ncbi:MAG: Holliday junction resolvase RuvX [Myxococcota bacterium]
MRRLGVDPGERRVGLAVADDDVGVAVPLRTVPGGARAVREVKRAAEEEGAEALVVGLPLRLDGSEGTAARRARRFGDAIARETGLPVEWWDERLTTVAAERSLAAAGVRGRDRRRVVDQSAAALVLQAYLDARRDPSEDEEDRWHEEGLEKAEEDGGLPGRGH